ELHRVALPLPAGVSVASIGKDQPGAPLIALGLSNGQVLIFRHTYLTTYPNNQKTITPSVAWPYGETPLVLDEAGRAVEHVTVSADGDSLKVAGSTGTQLHVMSLEQKENMMTGEMTREQTRIELPQMSAEVKAIYIDPRQQWMYVINGRAQADVFSLRDRSLNGRYKLLEDGNAEITASAQLVGGISLIIGNSKGSMSQWFMARDTDGEQRFMRIRDFKMGKAPIRQIRAEQRRKGFIALDESGRLGVFHSTAHRTLLVEKVADGPGILTLSPRANQVLIESGGKLLPLTLDNPHPEVSWSSLWGKVWY
ncbi:phosphate ABC transporter permease, partial [Pseudomonas syringae pv. actinidiae]|nr:phosphate ABC transporter permease [Pseudomonas syringae pv. actinidiae]